MMKKTETNLKSLRRWEAILFDLDGVLINSFHVWHQLISAAAVHFGHPAVSLEAFTPHWGKGTPDDVLVFMPGEDIREVDIFYEKHHEQYLEKVEVMDGAIDALKWISDSSFLTACVTNSPSAITKKVLAHTGMDQWLKVLSCASLDLAAKPAPDLVLNACETIGVSVSKACLVGDSSYDIEAGRRAGCATIGVGIQGDYQIQEMKELRGLLESL